MKAAAGKIQSVRELGPDIDEEELTIPTLLQPKEEDQVIELTYEVPDEFFGPIMEIAAKAPETHAAVIAETDCFAVCWEDEDGVCPLDGEGDNERCALRTYCEQAYNLTQLRKAQAARPATEGDTSPSLEEGSGKRKLDKSKPRPSREGRFKWKGTGKFERRGYTDLGRPVDKLVSHYVAQLGKPPVLPKNFNPTRYKERYGHLGRVAMTETASYHGLYVDSVLVARFWTNATTHALVDVHPDLVNSMSDLSDTLGYTADGRVHFSTPIEVSKSVYKKTKPCSHRASATTKKAVEGIVEVLKKHYSL